MGFLFAQGIEISVDHIAVAEIVRDYGVYVGQVYGRVFLVDLFRSGAFQEGVD